MTPSRFLCQKDPEVFTHLLTWTDIRLCVGLKILQKADLVDFSVSLIKLLRTYQKQNCGIIQRYSSHPLTQWVFPSGLDPL